MTVPDNATGEVGFLNEGFWGMDVRPGVFNASFYVLRSPARGNGTLTSIDVSLRSNRTSHVWASSSIDFSTASNISVFEFQQYSTQIVNTANAPNSNNTLAITFNASEVAGDTYYFGLLSCFPETFKDRPNGLRRDLAK